MRNYRFTPSEQRTATRFLAVGFLLMVIETLLFLFNVEIVVFVFVVLMIWGATALGWGLYISRKENK